MKQVVVSFEATVCVDVEGNPDEQELQEIIEDYLSREYGVSEVTVWGVE